MTIRIENVEADQQQGGEGSKRQEMPSRVHWDCPGCGVKNTMNLEWDATLTHPVFGEPYALELYCWEGEDCGHEFTVSVIPRRVLTLELAEP